MMEHPRCLTIKMMSVFVFCVSVAVLIGWELSIDFLKSIYGGWVTMKPLTAFSFALSAGLTFFLRQSLDRRDGDSKSSVFVTMCSFAILWTEITAMMKLDSQGLIFMHLQESAQDAIYSKAPGVPSLGSFFCFYLIALVGFTATINTRRVFKRIRILGVVLTSIASVALLGYWVNEPTLYYYIEGKSSAMAIHTAVCFLMLGVSYLLIPSTYKKED